MASMRWVTFDCFGTLVDWRHGISTSADLLAPGQGPRLVAAYIRHEQQVQAESPTMRYRDVLAETLRRACADEGVPLSRDDAGILGVTLPFWPVFPDVATELTTLREAGWNLGLLTNCDLDLIGETRRRLPVPFEAVVTSEDAGAYKPADNHFDRFDAAFQPEQWVHVAQGYVHDMVPAHRLGIARVWINRQDERPADPSILQQVLPDLKGLLAAVERA